MYEIITTYPTAQFREAIAIANEYDTDASYQGRYVTDGTSVRDFGLFMTGDASAIRHVLSGNDTYVEKSDINTNDPNNALNVFLFNGDDVYFHQHPKMSIWDFFDGGSGHDTLHINAESSRFLIQTAKEKFSDTHLSRGTLEGYYLIDQSGLINDIQIDSVERIHFSDAVVAFDINGVAGQAYRLYEAALDRSPDPMGLAGWIRYMDHGGSLGATAQMFIDSAEFRVKYGTLDDRNFINQLYLNVLERAPDVDGLSSWLAALGRGSSRADVLIGFSESTENKINLQGQVDHGIEYAYWN